MSSSPHDGIKNLTEYLDNDEDVVLIEEASLVSLKHEIVLEVVLDDNMGDKDSVLVV